MIKLLSYKYEFLELFLEKSSIHLYSILLITLHLEKCVFCSRHFAREVFERYQRDK